MSISVMVAQPITFSGDASPVVLTRDLCFNGGAFGWSDIPCQGEHFVDYKASDEAFVVAKVKTPSFEIIPTRPVHSRAASVSTVLSQPSTKKARTGKRVRFSPVLEVRTHSIVLGDHPYCKDGLPIECGWDHSETELLDLEVHEDCSPKRRMNQLHLCYFERLRRLEEVTGLDEVQLFKQRAPKSCASQALPRTATLSSFSELSVALRRVATRESATV